MSSRVATRDAVGLIWGQHEIALCLCSAACVPRRSRRSPLLLLVCIRWGPRRALEEPAVRHLASLVCDVRCSRFVHFSNTTSSCFPATPVAFLEDERRSRYGSWSPPVVGRRTSFCHGWLWRPVPRSASPAIWRGNTAQGSPPRTRRVERPQHSSTRGLAPHREHERQRSRCTASPVGTWAVSSIWPN